MASTAHGAATAYRAPNDYCAPLAAVISLVTVTENTPVCASLCPASVGRGYGVMLVRNTPVAVHLEQAHGQPE
jgi:hypothetical protein